MSGAGGGVSVRARSAEHAGGVPPAAEPLLAAGFLPVGREGTLHYRNPERDTDRWVRRADVQTVRGGQNGARVHVWRAFT